MLINIVDHNEEVIEEAKKVFDSVHHGDLFDLEVEAVVSPGNCFGYMDDDSIRDFFGYEIEDKIQKLINKEGHLNVGDAFVAKTKHEVFKYVIVSPTVFLPGFPALRLAPYKCMTNILQIVEDNNIGSVSMTGLGSGFGGLHPQYVIREMFRAYLDFGRIKE